MNLAWSEEQLKLRGSVMEFAREALDAALPPSEDGQPFSRAVWQACAEFGILGLPIPEEFGGTGQDVMTTMLAMEALGVGCRDQGLLFSLHAHMWAVQIPILAFGTAEQKRHYLPKLVDGSWIGAHGMSEPDSGTDAFAMRTRAERRGDCYVLDGSKTFVTNAPAADVFVVFATVNAARGMWGVTAFLIDRDTKGLSIGSPIHKMGLTTSPMAGSSSTGARYPRRTGSVARGKGAPSSTIRWRGSAVASSRASWARWSGSSTPVCGTPRRGASSAKRSAASSSSRRSLRT